MPVLLGVQAAQATCCLVDEGFDSSNAAAVAQTMKAATKGRERDGDAVVMEDEAMQLTNGKEAMAGDSPFDRQEVVARGL